MRWSGGRSKTLRVLTGMGLWHAPGVAPVPLNYLVTRDPEGTQRDAADFCTDGKMPPAEVLGHVVGRWNLEVTFAELRTHLGMETQRQWSDLAIRRTTPVLMGLYSVICVLAMRWYGDGSLEAKGSAWYAKVEPTFLDYLALARRRIWGSRIKSGSTPAGDPLQLTESLGEAISHGLSRAA